MKVGSGRQGKGLERLASQVQEEVNVKALEVVADLPAGEGSVASEGDLAVMLDTNITPQLAAEGLAREIVHRLQNMRRAAGFDIADSIVTYYRGEAYVGQVMADFADYIRQETLSRELVDAVPEEADFQETYKLSGYDVLLGVKKLA